jgi:hypothetical protein
MKRIKTHKIVLSNGKVTQAVGGSPADAAFTFGIAAGEFVSGQSSKDANTTATASGAAATAACLAAGGSRTGMAIDKVSV